MNYILKFIITIIFVSLCFNSLSDEIEIQSSDMEV